MNSNPGSRAAAGAAAKPSPQEIQRVAEEVRRLIAQGKCKQAVELAKVEHKRCSAPETEHLVVDAYLSRIDQFQKKGALEDARILIKLVQERFPAHRGRLTGVRTEVAAGEGRVDDLVVPLAQANVPISLRKQIEKAISTQLVDIEALAQCQTLPPQHPLRIAATAVHKAFEAVTTGPVTDPQIQLDEVPAESPLCAWKLLIRGIALLYRNQDDECRRTLAMITPDTAVHRLASLCVAIVLGQSVGGGLAGALVAQVVCLDEPLRKALKEIEDACRYGQIGLLRRAVRTAMATCAAVYPDLVERLREQILYRCMVAGAPSALMVSLIGPPRRDAMHWKFLACRAEHDGDPACAAVLWDRFVRHAVAEGQFAADSLPAAVVYLHCARLLAPLSPDELAEERAALKAGWIWALYRDQEPQIAALAPAKAGEADCIREATSPHGRFRKAASIHPTSQTFHEWSTWSENAGDHHSQTEEIAEFWHEKLPNDPKPLLLLCDLAEDRNALKLALKRLGEAEAMDALNPVVRQARLRLTLRIAWHHFRDGKPHLVEKDIAALEQIQAMCEGDGAGYRAAIRAAWHVLRCEETAARQTYEAVVERLGPLAASTVMRSVMDEARLPGTPEGPHTAPVAAAPPQAVAEAAARTVLLSERLPLRLSWPSEWLSAIRQALEQEACPLTSDQIAAIGRFAWRCGQDRLAYVASAAGLVHAHGTSAARFLLLRANALPPPAVNRIAQCLRTARELARHSHDTELMDQISQAIDSHWRVRQMLAHGGDVAISDAIIADVLKAERAARAFPTDVRKAEDAVVLFDHAPRLRPRPVEVWDDDEEEEYDADNEEEMDEEDGAQPSLFDESAAGAEAPDHDVPWPDYLPPGAQALLDEVAAKYGHVPTPRELSQRDPGMVLRIAAQLGAIPIDPKVVDKFVSKMNNSRGKGKR